MKEIKLYTLFLFALASFEGFAQQVNINVNAVPASIQQGKTGYIEVNICNVDASPITAPANKLRPLISVPGNVTITGVTDVNGNPLTGFTVLSLSSGTGNSIRLLATEPLPNFECFDFHVTIEGVNVGANDVVTGTLGFQGPPTTNDVPADNNATTGVEVISPLPVKLISFNVKKEELTANLNWSTTEEINSDRFDIQRSMNAKEWIDIGTVASNGESAVKRDYRFIDKTPSAGLNYYRLKMVDKDNTYTYSRAQSLNFEGSPSVSVFPNPVSEVLFVKDAAFGTTKSVSLVNMSGNTVYQAASVPAEGINVTGLANGMYIVKVVGEGGALYTHKVVIGK